MSYPNSSTSTTQESKYWILDIDSSNIAYQSLSGYYGVVDEVTGVIMAYFKDETQANLFVELLQQ